MVDRFEKFSSVISSISHNLHRIMGEEMEKYGLKGPYAVYLVAMSRHPQGVTAARLCEICEKNKAAVSRAVAELEENGLLVRSGSNYRTLLQLTDEGKKAANYVCQRARVAVDFAGKGLTEEQRTVFYNVLDLIATNLKKFGK